MKRILALLLAMLMVFALVACGGEKVETEDEKIEIETPESDVEAPVEDAPDADVEAPASPEETPDPTPAAKDEPKPSAKPAVKDEAKPEVKDEAKPAPAPEVKPEEKPAEKVEEPEEKPEEKPAETTPSSGKTTGDIMLSVFRANRDKSLDEIANACISDPSIQFFGMTAPMEEGFFIEFDGDVKGFDKCVKFGPAMGSIAFSGMIFEVSGDAAAFAKELKERANPRWNICVEADQTVCEVYGNRVFFLMCPKTLGE